MRRAPHTENESPLHAPKALSRLTHHEDLGSGNFNRVVRLQGEYAGMHWVKKTAADPRDLEAHPRRAIRIFRELNGEDSAYLCKADSQSWYAQYFKQRPQYVTDQATTELILQIYKKTGRIFLDPVARNIGLLKKPGAKLAALDVDLILRPGSPESDKMLCDDEYISTVELFLQANLFVSHPITRKIVSALLFLSSYFYSISQQKIPVALLHVNILVQIFHLVHTKNHEVLKLILTHHSAMDEDLEEVSLDSTLTR